MTLLVVYGVAITCFLLFVLLLLDASQKEARKAKAGIDDLTAERDAARHEAHEYRADAADQLKLANAERNKRELAEERASRMAQALDTITDENTRIRADIHALLHRWK